MAGHTKAAAKELTSASRYQKNARKRACWLMLILCIILTVVLLAVGPFDIRTDRRRWVRGLEFV